MTIKCWGSNSTGALGYGDTETKGTSAATSGDNLPAVDLGTVSYPVQVSALKASSCARFANGGMKCWEDNSRGELGIGTSDHMGNDPGEMGDNLNALDLNGDIINNFHNSGAGACIAAVNGNVKCWGRDNRWGQLGQGHVNGIGDDAGEMGASLPPVSITW